MVNPDQVIVALDLDNEFSARSLVSRLSESNVAFKIGLQAYVQWGPSFVRHLVQSDLRVFLDLKFHDIPNTVARAVKASHDMGVWMINLHISSGSRAIAMARETLDALPPPRPLLMGVTVLTSLAESDLEELKLPNNPAAWAVHLARTGQKAGLDGVICSAQEVGSIKSETGSSFLAVTPGIRLPDAQKDDQRRIMTPEDAVRAGSDYLVIGRPITQASDPLAVVEQITT